MISLTPSTSCAGSIRAWSSHSLENVAIRLDVPNEAERWALSDAQLVKDMFLSMLQRIPTLKKISEFIRVSQPLAFADAPGCAIEAPPGIRGSDVGYH